MDIETTHHNSSSVSRPVDRTFFQKGGGNGVLSTLQPTNLGAFEAGSGGLGLVFGAS